jgi:group I intron endonuclease
MIGVYEIVNKVNGKKYIGSSADDINKRRRAHFNQLRRGDHNNPLLQRSFNKYGEKVFEFQPILVCSPSDVLSYEQTLIDGLHPEYNLCPDAASMLGYQFTPEQSKRMSVSHLGQVPWNKGIQLLESQKAKLRVSQRGHIPWNKGKKATRLACLHQCESHLGLKHTEESKLKRLWTWRKKRAEGLFKRPFPRKSKSSLNPKLIKEVAMLI